MQRGRLGSIAWLVVLVLTVGMATSSALAETIYVKEGGTGGGTSWADAYGDLQDALGDASSGDEIWVAAGTYYPTWDYGLGIGDRGKHFRMINGVGIYGGFAGTETALDQRDVGNNETILSGDIGTPGDDSDNCYHIFYHPDGTDLAATAVLDGFTITAGNANGSGEHRHGGGMYNNNSSSPTVTGCTFGGNSAYLDGGGMYNSDNSSPTVTGCTFSGNSAGDDGGGMANSDNSSPTVTGCTFSGNSSNYWGGGMYNYSSSPAVSGCTFTGNSAGLGGGMWNNSSSPTVSGCTFTGNSAGYGGGMKNSSSSPVVMNCTFSGNSAGERGGGMDSGSSSPTVSGCTFIDNSAGDGGGMYNSSSSSPTVSGCTFTGNSAGGDGGGMLNNYSSSPIVTNCTFASNLADVYGGGMYNEDSSSPKLRNCILWGNTAASEGNEIYNDSGGIPVISYCDIGGCFPGGLWDTSLGADGGGNIDVDPVFVDADGGDDTPGTEDDNLRLQVGSPCIDTGDSSAVTVGTDMDGQLRIMDGDNDGTAIVDMGAYEYYGDAYEPVVIYVNGDATGTNTGLSWADAYVDLQDALDAAIIGDEIWVAAGTYYPSVEVGGSGSRYQSFQMKNYVAIYGGFAGTETSLDQRDVGNNVAILSGDIGIVSDDSDNCYHVFYHASGLTLNASAVLDGFTITAGTADGSGVHSSGGGMYNKNSSPSVTGCTFSGNSAKYDGGGMYNDFGSLTVSNCTFMGNSAGDDGGGMYDYFCSSTVTGCTFTSNSAGDDGGGMYHSSSGPTVSGCTFTGNSAGDDGGGMHDSSGCPTVTGCTFTGNSAGDCGGIYNYDSKATFTNCTFASNLADFGGGMCNWGSSTQTITGCMFIDNSAGDGGGMYNRDSGSLIVTNCTFASNLADFGGGMYNCYSSSPMVTGCILWGNTAASEGNEIYNDPGISYPCTAVISYCDIAGCLDGGSWDTFLGTDGGGNIDMDPLFVDAAGGDFHLEVISTCINAGDNSAPSLPATDFDGDPRIIYGIVDIGADEVAGDVLISLNVTIEPSTGACTVTLDPTGGMYPLGTEVSITVDGEEGFIFDNWSGDLSGNDNPATITMDSPKYVTAHFTFNGDVIYVDADATGSNNGTSWADALTDLQDGLDSAGSGDEIWVAAGTYKPTSDYGLGIGDRGRHFRMINGVGIYGGFAGTETALDQRDAGNNVTILSGDIGILGNNSDNCYHVFYHPDGTDLDTTAVLDGFTITAGHADGAGGHDYGGGMYSSGSSPIVSNCIFSGNWAKYGGGGMQNSSSSPTISNCTFSGNWAGCGGGMYDANSSSTVTNCIFTSNSAGGYGGGMYNGNSSPTVTNCILWGNYSGNSGGGMYNNWSSSPTVTNCILWGNAAASGGNRIYNEAGSVPVISYCDIVNCFYSGSWATSLGVDGGGNIDGDPLFVDAAGGDFHLQETSPCINAGDNIAPSLPVTDFEGDPRIIYGIVDIGADEVAGDVLISLNVTIEPFERACTVTLDPAGGLYSLGTEVTVTVEAEEGYVFDRWSGDLSGSDNSGTLTMDSPKYVTAHFAINSDVIYVDDDATGLNSGSSWDDALTDLQDALDVVAISGKDIWVAAGMYHPSVMIGGSIPPYRTFQMINGVAIYGGFDGSETALDQRDVGNNETILSGAMPGYNCLRVFYHPDGTNLDASAVLDGFTVTAAECGMSNEYSSPTVTNCTFTVNWSEGNGGGMYNYSSSPTVSNCTFSGNSAWDNGGGMYNEWISNPTVSNCTFAGNDGGGMANKISSPTVIHCTFIGNDNGGMYNSEYSSPTVTNCTFTGNSAGSVDGGGMYNSNFSSPTVTGCIFSGNSAYDGGGMFNYEDSSPRVMGCTFTGNVVIRYGGGMCNEYGSHPAVTGCIFWGNSAFYYGDDEIYNHAGTSSASIPVISYCDIGGCGGSGAGWDGDLGTDGGGNIDGDPLFVDGDGPDDTYGTEDDDLRLSAGSPCIDAGDNIAVTVGTDLDGQGRIMEGDDDGRAIVDMGAYEYYGDAYEPVVMYVNAGATGGNNNGLSWEDAFTLLQDALDATIFGDEIWVAAGTYYPSVEVGGSGSRYRTFQMKNGVGIYGGFAGIETALDQRDVGNNETILSGDIGISGNNSDNCYHVVYHLYANLDSTAILDGFTITAGNADSSGYGGGMYNSSSSPTIANCTFTGNSAGRYGGGMHNISSSSPTVMGCTFTDNDGGGMYNGWGSSPRVTGCTFAGNSGEGGGGMYNDHPSRMTVTDCMFAGNSADSSGGGMYNYFSSPSVTGCTFIGNSAGDCGGGMANRTSRPVVLNCILRGNTAVSGGNEIALMDSSTIDAAYCDVEGGQFGIYDDGSGNVINWGGGNIDADPLFVTGPLGDYYLSQVAAGQGVNSPCVNAGSDMAENLGMDTYTTRSDEIVDLGIVDMGYHYSIVTDPDVNGDGRVDLVDFGIVSGWWMDSPCDVGNNFCGEADIDHTGDVGLGDLFMLAGNWLAGVCFPTAAFGPEPADGAADVKIRPELSWSAGECAVSHNIYFGTGSPGEFQGNQTETTFDPGALELETTYYWRIDEVQGDSSVVEGDVWRFTTRSDMLVGRWELDESSGTVASDSVGGHDGTLMGDPVWRPGDGKIGGALEFDGVGDYVEVAGYKGISGSNPRTVTAWVKTEPNGSTFSIVRWGAEEISGGLWSNVINAAGNLRVAVWGGSVVGDTTINDDTWHHVAIVLPDKWNVKVEDILLYVDGEPEDTIISSGSQTIDTGDELDVSIATDGSDGLLDDVRIYNYALSEDEIGELVCILPAFEPDPADGASGVNPDTELSWSARKCVVSHNIYFGTSSPGEFQGNQTGTTFDPGALDLGTMYYWRIDEVQADSSVVEGDVWRFTTGDLVGQWELDESSGTVASDSVGGNDGTLNGDPVWWPSDGKIGGALEFDGVGDYVEIEGYKGISRSNARTVTAWVKTEPNGSTFSIVRWGTLGINGGLWSNVINAEGKLRAAVVGGSVVGDTTINDDTWHHVAIVLPDKEDVKVEDILLYVDGGQEDTTISLGSQAIDTAVGMDVLISLDGSVGLLDDVRIYNYALNAEEIGALAGVL